MIAIKAGAETRTENHTKIIIKDRREYNSWVASETLEDYALRYTPKSFRKWSEFLVANTAMGGISFLALEAIGGSIAISYGFANSFWAIIVVGAIIFLAGIPICYYASKYNIDMDLLTRGAGFGYIGSTITSLIYASFTFIFFALEAAIMSQALELYFHLPLPIGYIVCSLIIIPLVFFGVTLINQIQLWTQPLWLILMIAPYIFVLYKEPAALSNWFNFAGRSTSGAAFDPLLFGSAATVSFSLIAQLGEQVDYLRFLPDKTEKNRTRWWLAAILAGPGWIILGGAKQLGGAFLASLAISHGVSFTKAVEPIQMYLAGYEAIFSNPGIVLTVGTLFVIISQIKINVTNAYAGSLAWSNFFSRVTHSHPGRVVWLVFNVAIALVMMELGVFATLEKVLGLYSNVAIAWIGALVADLAINKPLGISPSYIEFKRAYLYNINPVGFGSMLVGSLVAIAAFVGTFGPLAQAYSPFIALGLAFILAPIIAILTKGKYYIARENVLLKNTIERAVKCSICASEYEPEDMAYCPVYDGYICSLCCSLNSRCHDSCKHSQITTERLSNKIKLKNIFAQKISPYMGARILKFIGIFSLLSVTVGACLGIIYYQEIWLSPEIAFLANALLGTFIKLYAALLVLIGIGTWWLVLAEESRELAEAELDKQNLQMQQEIIERKKTEIALRKSESKLIKQAKILQETLHNLNQTQAQLIQTEKMSSLGQLVAGVAHEINNPVNFIYANITHVEEYSNNLLDLIKVYQECYKNTDAKIEDLQSEIELDFLKEDLPKMLDSMKVGANRIREIVLTLRNFSRLDEAEMKPVNIHQGIDSTLLILQHRLKAKPNRSEIEIIKEYRDLPAVECYAGKLNQVFMNILSNGIDALEQRENEAAKEKQSLASPSLRIATEMIDKDWVRISIKDNGIGITEMVKSRLFDPFFTTKPVGQGTGLGLSISYQIIVEHHGGRLRCLSTPKKGTEFQIEIPIRQS
ncbi:MAG TPA: histidine kinase [Cyanobacteria bacterium UBA11372]|nr:histidine kinase [Cyanobacteria bacterium UBA11372]